MTFADAIEHLKHGALIRQKGSPEWSWLGKSGVCYYGQRRDNPIRFRDTWLSSEVLADDWETEPNETDAANHDDDWCAHDDSPAMRIGQCRTCAHYGCCDDLPYCGGSRWASAEDND